MQQALLCYNNVMKTVKILLAGAAAVAVAQVVAMPGASRRAEAEKEAQAVYEQLTPEECVKLAMMDSPAVDRIGLPKFHWWSEALHGYAWSGMATVFPLLTKLAFSGESTEL